jgi:serine/threonine-protein kinase RsbW
MSIWWSLHLRCETASVPFVRRLFLGTMETAGVDPDVSHDLSVALSEACANAVEHAGSNGAGQNGYSVTAHIEGDRCRIEVTDSGPGFTAPTRTSAAVRPLYAKTQYAEGGRGLHLIQALTDHVHVHSRPGQGAVVSFDKVLKWRTDSLLKAS